MNNITRALCLSGFGLALFAAPPLEDFGNCDRETFSKEYAHPPKYDSGDPLDCVVHNVCTKNTSEERGAVSWVQTIDIRAYDDAKPDHGPDLNKGAGGKWIYLELTKGSNPTFRQLAVAVNDGNSGWDTSDIYEKCPQYNGWGVDETDMNWGAGGSYLYCVYTSMGQTRRYIEDIVIITGSSSQIQPPLGYDKIDIDLNRNAKGEWIFMCYKSKSPNHNPEELKKQSQTSEL